MNTYKSKNSIKYPNPAAVLAHASYYKRFCAKNKDIGSFDDLLRGKRMRDLIDCTPAQWLALTVYQRRIAIDRAIYQMIGQSVRVQFIPGNSAKLVEAWIVE